ncbi:hypothetical protein [Ensifer sp. SSB1]|jgi:hypothetical protein|uniref:hypothetical protein n=1 Tax=Ensifer sp. SSB1 TaxID=2795385 RepID=UPI001A384103|nr:hypothetical protein [Ensifer sp. SSB1]MBK5571572.1 hypothetical protein [Ensifer sp. SSB1]
MSNIRTRLWLQFGCVGAALFAAANFWLSLVPVDISPLEEVDRNPASKVTSADVPTLTRFELTEAVARPLFSPTRREFEPQTPVVEEQPQLITPPSSTEIGTPSFSLHGTRNIQSRPAALISFGDQSQAEWYEVGQSIDGWQLVSVRPDGVSVIKADVSHDVQLYQPSDMQNAPR